MLKKFGQEEIESKKRRAWFGLRASSRITDEVFSPSDERNGDMVPAHDENSTGKTKENWKQNLIISIDNQSKAIFDIVVLLLVLYSCIVSVFYVAFNPKISNEGFTYFFEKSIEYIFILDIFLNFF
jgi:hypothetical protein